MHTHDFVVLASAARTAATEAGPFSSQGAAVLMLFVDATAETGSAEVTLSVVALDHLGGEFTVWTAAAAISATGKTSYAIGVGLDASAPGGFTDVENVPVPPTFKVKAAVADADSLTYSVFAALVG